MVGYTVLFYEDFRCLSVTSRGTRADQINASLKTLYHWPHLTKCEFKTNKVVKLCKIVEPHEIVKLH